MFNVNNLVIIMKITNTYKFCMGRKTVMVKKKKIVSSEKQLIIWMADVGGVGWTWENFDKKAQNK